MTWWKHNRAIRFLVWPYALWYCAPTWVKVLILILLVSITFVCYHGFDASFGSGGAYPYVSKE